MDYIEITERTIRHLSLRFIVKIENKKRWRGGVCRWSQQWLSNHVSFEGFDSQEGRMHHISKCLKIVFWAASAFISLVPRHLTVVLIFTASLFGAAVWRKEVSAHLAVRPRASYSQSWGTNRIRISSEQRRLFLSLTGCLIDIWECKDLWFPVIGILISNAVHSN